MLLLLPALQALSSVVLAATSVNYHAVTPLILGGHDGWDYLQISETRNELYQSHADRVVVFDLQTGKKLGEVTETPGVHGIALAEDLNSGFASNGKEGKVSVFDLKTLKTLRKVNVGEKPDAIVYVPSSHEIYAFNGKSQTASIFPAAGGPVVTLKLPGKPEFANVDETRARVFVNIEDQNQVVAIDTKAHKISNTWALTGCESPSGQALDEINGRLFAVCENKKMVMLDLTSGHVVSSVEIDEGADGVAYDPAAELAMSSNGHGSVTIAKESPDHMTLTRVQSLATQPGARTIAVHSKTHRIYLPTGEFMSPNPSDHHAKIKDNSQIILVYEP